MKIDVSKLSLSKETLIDEDVVFSSDEFKCHFPLLEVKTCHVHIKASRYDDFIDLFVSIKANVILQCSYTLKPFDSLISGSEEYHYASYVEDGDEETLIYQGNFINLDEMIFNLLSASIPLKPIAPNAKCPESGKGYRVINEDDYLKEKEDSYDSRFDALKDLEFDD